MSQPPVLLIDDDNDFVVLFNYAAQKAGLDSQVQLYASCEEAQAHLQEASSKPAASAPIPGLILLDGSASGDRTFDFVKWIRANPSLRRIPVAILSGSDSSLKMKAGYEAGIDAYIIKPVGLASLVGLIVSVKRLWLK